VTWLVGASIAAVIGVGVGALVDPLAHHLLVPAFQQLQKRFRRNPTP